MNEQVYGMSLELSGRVYGRRYIISICKLCASGCEYRKVTPVDEKSLGKNIRWEEVVCVCKKKGDKVFKLHIVEKNRSGIKWGSIVEC